MTVVPEPSPHPLLADLAPLLGTWRGTGHGEYPTIEPFDYVESVTFGHVGKPFLAYSQRTVAADDGRPLHAESGYLRAVGEGRLEWVLSHPFGAVEVAEGTVAVVGGELLIDVAAVTVVTTATAKPVTEVTRTLSVRDGYLTYDLAMAAVGQPLLHHLRATLQRVEPPSA